VLGYILEEERLDAGDKLGYLKTNIILSLRRKDLGEDLKKFLRELKI
jgi:UTP-glucose-1-phosphate uridylyltransferase